LRGASVAPPVASHFAGGTFPPGDRYDPNSAIRNSQSPEDEAEALREEHKSTDSKEKTNSEKADETKMPTLLRSLEVR
jgi:hypothetical protein